MRLLLIVKVHISFMSNVVLIYELMDFNYVVILYPCLKCICLPYLWSTFYINI